mmetsp:Transcript_832/g.1326  ORF Transcript_832/g.1326 Transcript_832/m.1326 type:complete len:96 (-) Transcript_832:643-930(-)
MVDKRCAITMVVRPDIALSKASCTTFSDLPSNADVASSNNNIFGSLMNARAMAMRCFWPPDNLLPFAPITVLYPCGNELIKSCALAALAARSISL